MTATTMTTTQRRREAAQRLGAPLIWRPSAGEIAEATAALARVQERVSTRCLHEDDLHETIALYCEVQDLAVHRRLPVRSASARMNGHAVPNSYGFRAYATWIDVDSCSHIRICRGAAVSASRGNSWTKRAELVLSESRPCSPPLRGQKARRAAKGLTLTWTF